MLVTCRWCVLLVVVLVLPVAGALSTPAAMPSRARASKSAGPGNQVDGVAGIGGDLQVFGAAGVIDRGLADAAQLGVDLGDQRIAGLARIDGDGGGARRHAFDLDLERVAGAQGGLLASGPPTGSD